MPLSARLSASSRPARRGRRCRSRRRCGAVGRAGCSGRHSSRPAEFASFRRLQACACGRAAASNVTPTAEATCAAARAHTATESSSSQRCEERTWRSSERTHAGWRCSAAHSERPLWRAWEKAAARPSTAREMDTVMASSAAQSARWGSLCSASRRRNASRFYPCRTLLHSMMQQRPNCRDIKERPEPR